MACDWNGDAAPAIASLSQRASQGGATVTGAPRAVTGAVTGSDGSGSHSGGGQTGLTTTADRRPITQARSQLFVLPPGTDRPVWSWHELSWSVRHCRASKGDLRALRTLIYLI